VTQEINYLDPQEFIDGGYLQELNRRFLHPLGLALEVGAADGDEFVCRVWDYRADPDGINFAGELPDPQKTNKIDAEWRDKAGPREKALGYVVQPVLS
jgi:hypothetical protein